MIKRLVTIGWALTGLVVAALAVKNSKTLPDPEMAFGYACSQLLVPGLVGLMLAAIVASNMSACSNFMVNTGALFTQNLFRKYVRPKASDRDLLWMGRYSGLGLSVLAVLFALSIKNVLHAFLFTETLAAFMGIMFLGGLIWKRANRFGAGTAVISSFCVYYIANFLMTGKFMLVYRWEPAPFGIAMLTGFFMFWLISILTKPEDKEKIEAFFDNMRRKSDAKVPGTDGKKPLAADYGEDLILLDLPGWMKKERRKNFFHRYREDLIGFFLAWIVVGFLILFAWAILQI
jgi:SSS family solute:Na+ symporter